MSDPHKRNPVNRRVETMARQAQARIIKAELVAESRCSRWNPST